MDNKKLLEKLNEADDPNSDTAKILSRVAYDYMKESIDGLKKASFYRCTCCPPIEQIQTDDIEDE